MKKRLLLISVVTLCLTAALATGETTTSETTYPLTGTSLKNATVVVTKSGTTITNGSEVSVGDNLKVSVTPNSGYYFSDGSTDAKTASITVTEKMVTTGSTDETEATYYNDFKAVAGTWSQVNVIDKYYSRETGWQGTLPYNDYEEKQLNYMPTTSGTLTFDYAVNNGTFKYGQYEVYLYVNGEKKKTYNYYTTERGTSEENYADIQSETEGVSVYKGDIVTWGFKLTAAYSWASDGQKAYIGNVKIKGTGEAIIDISSAIAEVNDFALHYHTFGTDGKCITCGTFKSYTLSDYTTNLSKIVQSVAVTRDGTALEAGATLTYGETLSVTITPKDFATWSDDATIEAGTARTFDITVGATDPNTTISEKLALVVCKHTNMTSGICDGCGYYEPITAGDDGVYQIATAGNLMAFADIVNGTNNATQTSTACAKVTANIDFSQITSATYTPIGVAREVGYQGTFDGDGHTITMNIDTDANSQALFGYVGTCTIKNVTIAGTIKSSGIYVAGIAANESSYGINIVNCHNTATISGKTMVGGIFGHCDNYLTMTNCTNTGTISASGTDHANCGGIVGRLSQGNITLNGCVNEGEVSTSERACNIGGIVGSIEANEKTYGDKSAYVITLENCANGGKVTAGSDPVEGSIVGAIANYGTLKNCYNRYDGSTDNSDLKLYNASNADNCTVTNCYDINTATNSNVTVFTADQMNSGELCYKLNGETATDDVAWRQTLTGDNADTYPTISTDSKIVYYAYPSCTATEKEYSNENNPTTQGEHSYGDNGFCKYCNAAYAALTDADKVDGVYQIKNGGNLYAFADIVNGANGATQNAAANAIVTADIDLTGAPDYTADGTNYNTLMSHAVNKDPKYYSGIFDGGNHTITLKGQRLFTYLAGSTLKNIKTAGTVTSTYDQVGGIAGVVHESAAGITTIAKCHNSATVTGKSEVGGIIGYVKSSTVIEDCSNSGAITATTGEYNGGIAGCVNASAGGTTTITNCHNSATVTGKSEVGGIIGYVQSSIVIDSCSNSGTITATAEESNKGKCGGIAGLLANVTATLTKCVNTGEVLATYYIGGMVGQAEGGSSTTIEACANHGTVKARYAYSETYKGCLVGAANGLTLTSCYNDNTANSSQQLVGSGSYSSTRCFNINSSSAATTFTADELANGALCYKLNGGISDMLWYQKIGTDACPALSVADDNSNEVNCVMNIDGTDAQYFNTGTAITVKNQTTDGSNPALRFYVVEATAKAQESITIDATYNKNILVNDGSGNYTCEDAELLDANNYDIPYAYTAKKFTFARTLDTGNNGISTFILPITTAASNVNGTVYKLNTYNNGTLHYEEVTGDIEANTPYLVQNTTTDSEQRLFTKTLENVSVSAMKAGTVAAGDATHYGTYTQITNSNSDFTGKTIYGYTGGKFVKATGTWYLYPFRTLIAVSGDSPAKTLAIDLGGDVTGIDSIGEADGEKVDVYSIDGAKVRSEVSGGNALNGLPKGIYIVNGKKVVNK